MATTEILPFATGGGANVETQVAFAADPQTSTGFVSGTAVAQKLNKVWRQSSFIAAVIANWIVSKGINVPDDGNVSAAVTNLNTALYSSPTFSGPLTSPGTANFGSGAVQTDAAGNLGIGVTPSAWGATFVGLNVGAYGAIWGVKSASSGYMRVCNASYNNGTNDVYAITGTSPAQYQQNSDASHRWQQAAPGTAGNTFSYIDAMVLDANGNLVLPHTATQVIVGTNAGNGIFTNPTNGAFVRVYGSTAAGHSNELHLSGSGGVLIDNNTSITGNFLPSADNTYSLGNTSFRFSQTWCTAGAFNTSDARLKTEVTPLNDIEKQAAAALSKEIGTWQWLESIKDKGVDKARHHVGLTVQRAQEVLESFGLDPWRYGFMSYDKWDDEFVEHAAIEAADAVLDEDGNIVTPEIEAKDAWTQQTKVAGDAYAFRYDQLNLFIAAGIEYRLAALEAKL